MNKVRIVIDSTTDVAEGIRERLTVVPLTIRFGDEEYVDGIDITTDRFYVKLIETDVMPTTSQATPDNFAQIFEQIKAAGDTAVVLTIASKLSGTYQSAVIAAQDYEGIYVVDTNTVTIGAGILAELALRLVEEGLSAAEIAEKLETQKDKIRLIALVDTLEYLKKGGRISKAVAFAGGVLSIKPVIGIIDGEIQILGKARGSKQGNNLLVQEIEKSGGVDFTKPVLLGYTGISDLLLKKYIEDSAFLWEGNVEKLNTSIVGSVVGTHAGPGAVAAAYFAK